jgi:4-azaleucine resistance transporter AzlC
MTATHPAPDDARNEERRALRNRAISIAVALIPFGFAFGISVSQAGLSAWHAAGFSLLVFSGGSQFAAVGVLNDGGSPASAIASALLLGLRLLAYGVVMTPHLPGSRWTRALDSHLMIDESIAVGTAAKDPLLVRYGYRWGGLSIFVLWNVSTLIGVFVGANAGDLIERFGIDAAVPASFLALVWPRLTNREQLPVALLGGAIAFVLIPLAPAGIPILASGLAAIISFRRPGPGVWATRRGLAKRTARRAAKRQRSSAAPRRRAS